MLTGKTGSLGSKQKGKPQISLHKLNFYYAVEPELVFSLIMCPFQVDCKAGTHVRIICGDNYKTFAVRY